MDYAPSIAGIPMPERVARLPVDPVRKDPLYPTWRSMIRRCHCESDPGYENYGGRGVFVCDEWRNSFAAFVTHMGDRPSCDHSIDRIDNNGGYMPGNVRWATRAEQARNMRRTRRLTARGKTQTLEDWAAETGLSKSTLFNRLCRGWPDEAVIYTEPQRKAADNTLFPAGGRERCAALGINVYTVASRLRRGWSFERAVSVGVAKQKGGRGNAS